MYETFLILSLIIIVFIFFKALYYAIGIIFTDRKHDKKSIVAYVVYDNDNIEEFLFNVPFFERKADYVLIIDGGLRNFQSEKFHRYCYHKDNVIFTSPDMLSSIIFQIQKRR